MKKRVHSKAHVATALLDQFLDDSAMKPIREQQKKVNESLNFGIDYKDFKTGENFEKFVNENHTTIWHNPEAIKRDLARNSIHMANQDDLVVPMIGSVEPLGFITECKNDADDEGGFSDSSGSDSLGSHSGSEGHKSAPGGREGVVVDIESLDAGGSLDQGGHGRTSQARRSQFSAKRSMSLSKIEAAEMMNRSMDHMPSARSRHSSHKSKRSAHSSRKKAAK